MDILNIIKNIASSSITGNILSLISIIITLATLRSADKANRALEQMKGKAVELNNFRTQKIQLQKTIDELCKDLSKKETLNSSDYKQLSILLGDIRKYQGIFLSDDNDKLSDIATTIIKDYQCRIIKPCSPLIYIGYLNEIKIIIGRGIY